MPVYLFTLHAYRSWMPDRAPGYVRRGRGILHPDPAQAEHYHRRARHDPVVFDDVRCRLIAAAVREVCDRHDWRTHGIVVVWTHLHLLTSWRGFAPCHRVRASLKRAVTVALRDQDSRCSRWLAGGGSMQRVLDRSHFDRLLRHYLPGHRRYGGVCWLEATASHQP